MPYSRRVAFVSPISNVYVHRLIRGVLSYADSRSHAMVKEFRVPRDLAVWSEGSGVLEDLIRWNPKGIIGFLENGELERLLQLFPEPVPVVCVSGVRPRPGVSVVAGSIEAELVQTLRHFREIGIRSVGFLWLEAEERFEVRPSDLFLHLAKPLHPKRSALHQHVASKLLDDPDVVVSPVPMRLVEWLRALPKPCGVFCPQFGGGGYLIRVCRELGLRVPQDVAVVGVDDADFCLASNPPMTSVTPMGEMIGYEAMKLLSRMIGEAPDLQERIRVDAVDMHVRQSTALVARRGCDIAGALEMIRQQACQGLSVARLLEETQKVSLKTFHTHFKEATGMTPGEAILHQQLEEARRLLRQTRIPVTLVAEKSGFGSSSDFARRFRMLTGVSPTQYRNRESEENQSSR